MYHLKPNYQERYDVPTYSDEPQNLTWQPDVLPYALTLAKGLGAKLLVDLGCGNADKLATIQDFLTIGVDVEPNFSLAKQRHPSLRIFHHNLDSMLPLPLDVSESVVVLADVIEHLRFPQRILAHLASKQPVAVVISTPDRDLLYPPDHNGPPANEFHYREWSGNELRLFLASEGLDCQIAHTRSNTGHSDQNTLLATWTRG